jgi:hypothetical protein
LSTVVAGAGFFCVRDGMRCNLKPRQAWIKAAA